MENPPGFQLHTQTHSQAFLALPQDHLSHAQMMNNFVNPRHLAN